MYPTILTILIFFEKIQHKELVFGKGISVPRNENRVAAGEAATVTVVIDVERSASLPPRSSGEHSDVEIGPAVTYPPYSKS